MNYHPLQNMLIILELWEQNQYGYQISQISSWYGSNPYLNSIGEDTKPGDYDPRQITFAYLLLKTDFIILQFRLSTSKNPFEMPSLMLKFIFLGKELLNE